MSNIVFLYHPSPLLPGGGDNSRSERTFFYVFSAGAAEFWNKTVMYLWTVQKLAFRHRTEEQHVRSQTAAVMSGVFIVFFLPVLADQGRYVMQVSCSCDGADQQSNTLGRVASHAGGYRQRGTDCRQDGNDELDDVFDSFLFHRDLVLG